MKYPRFWKAYYALGSTQAERAARLGVTQRAVSWWESGKRMPTIASLINWPEGLRLLAEDIEKAK